MAGIQFIRRDFVIRLRSTGSEPSARSVVQTRADGRRRVVPLTAAPPGLEIRVSHDTTANTWSLPAQSLSQLTEQMPAAELAKVLWGDPPFRAELEQWQKSRSPAVWGTDARPDEDAPIDRICLRVEDDRLVALPLEQSLRDVLAEIDPTAWIPPIPRLISVPPRVLQIPLTLPLRLLQLDSRGDFHLRSVVRDVLGDNARGRGAASIVQVASGDSRNFASWALPPKWRTVDVLHLDRAQLATEDDLFLMSAPEKPGTLGWLVRCADVWRTRLVVLRGNGVAEMVSLRRLAHRLATQGGPAVALFDASIPGASDALRQFYASLLRDAPIDVAAATIKIEPPTLLLGAGRGELPRVSTPATQLASMASDLGDSDRGVRAGAAGNLWSLIAGTTADVGRATTLFARAGRGLLRIASDLPSWSFDLHQGAGIVPLGRSIGLLRLQPVLRPTSPLRPTSDQTGPRFVNLDLSRPGSERSREKIPQAGGRLRPDEAVVLGVQLGPRSELTPVLDAIALIEEPFKWDPNSAGVWLSVGVTGLDFSVIGAPIQEVWLPRHGASDVVEFVVEPMRTGVSQLRLCLYHGADLLQSHRLAALVQDPDVVDGEASSASLASALGIPSERADGFGWLARMEYAAVADLAAPPEERDVALSLFANDLDGRRVVTVRGKETYDVAIHGDTETLATDIRTRLDALSREKLSDGSALYAFRPRAGMPLHSGSQQQRDDALKALAEVGWNLYSAIFAGTDRTAMAKDLAGAGQIIHVAHSLLENVIPWAVIYDRYYDTDRHNDGSGRPLLRAVCPVGFPDAAGAFPLSECGMHDDCPLSAKGRADANAIGKGIAEEAIVCARHFWGFRHIVELPPLQEPDDAATAAAPIALRRPVTSAARPMDLLFGYNAELGTAAAHSAELDTLLTNSKLAGTWTRETDGDVFITALRRGAADLVYLFCHARGGKADPTVKPPALVFRERAEPPSRIRASALASGVSLSHHPLVILNGCNTAVFSPDALSPFIRTLVRDAQAAGVLGTEIPVFEVLASEVARLFLARFLAGKSAGQALMEVRHDLLARGNPMGLAYTLYAIAELRLVQALT